VPSETVNSSSSGLFFLCATLDLPYRPSPAAGIGHATAARRTIFTCRWKQSCRYSSYSRDAAAMTRIGSGANPFSLRTATSLLGGLTGISASGPASASPLQTSNAVVLAWPFPASTPIPQPSIFRARPAGRRLGRRRHTA
jgi:hypothetical protein